MFGLKATKKYILITYKLKSPSYGCVARRPNQQNINFPYKTYKKCWYEQNEIVIKFLNYRHNYGKQLMDLRGNLIDYQF